MKQRSTMVMLVFVGSTALSGAAFAQASQAWWKAIQDKDGNWVNQNIVKLCPTPETLVEVERERALRIWDSGNWMPKGGPTELAKRYLNKMPDDLKKKVSPLIKEGGSVEQAEQVREWFYLWQARERAALARKTIDFLKESGGVPPPSSVKALDELDKEIQAASDGTAVPKGSELFRRVFAARRAILFAHPALQFEKLLINKNPPTTFSHNCDQYRAALSRNGPGPAILSDWKTATPKTVQLFTGKLPEGAFQRPALSYDAKRFVFGFATNNPKANDRAFFLYEAQIDGSGLRQLTGTARDPFDTWQGRKTVPVEDEDPCYLPNGEIVFVSSRSQNFGRCHGGRFTPSYMLYKCDKDGNNIEQLSYGIENETTPSVLHDGRIIYTRWEYVDRHEMEFHKLWWKRPDGSMVSHYFGNDMINPLMISEAQAIPGTTRIIANAMGHHNFHYGTIVKIDTTKGENGKEAMTRITPEVLFAESNECGYNTYAQYCMPMPLTENLIFATYSPTDVPGMGRPPDLPYIIMLVDDFGGREPIYIDPDHACFSPLPIVARKAPAILPDQLPPKKSLKGKDAETGVYMIQNVNLTRNDPEKKIKPGTIKYLRFNEIYVKPIPSSDKISRDVPNAAPKRILGTVPVEPDGSVSVRVPAGVPLQIQALDEDFRAVLTERSFSYVHPGERRGCVGCHEPVGTALKPNKDLFTRAPRDLTPVPGQDDGEGVSFLKMVQPVLDRGCISCHGLSDKPPKGINLIAKPGNDWPMPYLDLLAYTKTIGNKGSSHGEEKNISRPYDYYALGGRFITVFMEKHKDKKLPLTKSDFQRIVNWLDVNAQCYGTFNHNRMEYYTINAPEEKVLREMIKVKFGKALSEQPICALVNGARPSESRILMAPLAIEAGGWGQSMTWKSKSDPEYKKFAAAVADLFEYPEPAVKGTCGFSHCRCGSCWVLAGIEDKTAVPQKGFDLPKYDSKKLNLVGVDCANGNEGGAKALDGDEKTMWHTAYSPKEIPYPHFISVKLASETEIAGLVMKNRGDNCNNGFIKKYRVSVSADGAKWTQVAEGKWLNTPNEQRMVFEKPVKANYVMLTGLSGWNSNALASIAELGVLLKK
jgi:hypothetical protein